MAPGPLSASRRKARRRSGPGGTAYRQAKWAKARALQTHLEALTAGANTPAIILINFRLAGRRLTVFEMLEAVASARRLDGRLTLTCRGSSALLDDYHPASLLWCHKGNIEILSRRYLWLQCFLVRGTHPPTESLRLVLCWGECDDGLSLLVLTQDVPFNTFA